MVKKIVLFLIALLIVSCGSSKPTASKKPVYRKPNTSVATRKPPVKKPVASRPVVKNSSGNTSGSTTNSSGKPQNSEVLEATTQVKVTTDMVLAYINQYKDIAKGNMNQYGIPSSIILAQGILESGAGTGPLSTMANNHFGIKCHKEWTGPSVRHDDDSEQECFRKYEQPSESYRDHALFLTTRSRYASLFELDKDDYKAWAKGLRAAGYATDPRYPEKLIGLIERYQLNRFDSEALGRDYVPVISPQVAADASMYQVIQGDTLYSISKKFNLSVDELKRKNNITDNAISIGQNLKVK